MEEKILVQTKCGSVEGSIVGQYAQFKGIPFAKAPRFGAPGPVSWDGVLECHHFGKKAMQVFDVVMPWSKPQTRDEFDEDCLNLNIYVPQKGFRRPGKIADCDGGQASAGKADSKAPGDGLPVLIEVHGGAFQTGSNQSHTPETMIRDHSFIYVPLNYRLGVFGFLGGNYGMMDLMAGIRWVYENISAFGGDPERITLLGSSAGAKAIGALMCTPDLKKYVHQIILSSGATQSIRDQKTAHAIKDQYMKILSEVAGIDPADESALMDLPADTLIAAQKILCDNPGNTCMFGPVADGAFLPLNWQELAKGGTLWEGRAMVGSSLHELAFYKLFNSDFSASAPRIADCLFGTNAGIARADFEACAMAYEKAHGTQLPPEQAGDAWVRILTDYMYRTYSYRLAGRLAAKGCQVWQYSAEFSPALHCFDQTLAFEVLMPATFNGKEHMEKARALGEKIYAAFARFVENGDPSCHDSDPSVPQWLPLNLAHPAQMIWDEQCQYRPIEASEVLQGIGEAVYQL